MLRGFLPKFIVLIANIKPWTHPLAKNPPTYNQPWGENQGDSLIEKWNFFQSQTCFYKF